MIAKLHARPESDAGGKMLEPRLLLNVSSTQDTCVVHVTGELDLATCNQLVSASTADHQPEMLIDLSGVAFMDCGGYRALVTSRRIIEGEGRSLRIKGQTGQPAHFLELIADLEQCPLRPA